MALWQRLSGALGWLCGDMSKQEADEMTKTTFRMPKSLLKEVQHYGVENEMTDTEIFNDAVKAWLKTHQRK